MANESKAPAQATCIWAQREDYILLTVQVEGCEKPDVKLTPEKLVFNGVGKIGKTDKSYLMEIEFLHPVIPEETKKTEPLSTRFIVMKIVKKEKAFWPRLRKDKAKVNWIKVDFANWRDEDESEEEDEKTQDLEKMMSQMGGGGFGGGMGGMPGMGGMGGMPGMGGMGGMDGMDFGDGAGADSDDEEDSDDEKMPDLE